MDSKEVMQLKIETEHKINELLNEFQEKSGYTISDFRVNILLSAIGRSTRAQINFII